MPAGHFEVAVHEKTIWIRYLGDEVAKEVDEDAKRAEEAAKSPRTRNREDDGSADEDPRKAYPARVRAWALLNKIEVPKHGRLSNELMAQYSEATGDPRPGSL
jgi:hypothetical protein